ncbi:MAG: PIN domain-containing protein [Pseudonocardia sp.]
MSLLALDTSVAVPLLARSHIAHDIVRKALRGREPVLTAHSQADTYSVLTRLPADARVAPADAVALLEADFGPPLLPDPDVVERLPRILAGLGIAGGAVYDGLIGLAARHHDVPLASRDARALGTYTAVGATVELIAR